MLQKIKVLPLELKFDKLLDLVVVLYQGTELCFEQFSRQEDVVRNELLWVGGGLLHWLHFLED